MRLSDSGVRNRIPAGKHRKAVLNAISGAGPEGISIGAISRVTGISTSRVISCLEPEDMVYEEKRGNITRLYWCGR